MELFHHGSPFFDRLPWACYLPAHFSPKPYHRGLWAYQVAQKEVLGLRSQIGQQELDDPMTL